MSGQIEGLRGHRSRKKPERNFKVFIHKGEFRQIEEWVLMKPNIETGGDLFGLWVDQHTAVVQFVLGPGKHCKRTTASFYQDVDYLEKAGKYLTKQHGLCNIGQWHSHHRIPLPQPSGGDENTVWGNMPNLGLNRYIVFIATIQGDSHKPNVGVNCFLFEIENDRELPVLKGTLEQIQGKTNSPFRVNKKIHESTRRGAESINSPKIIRKTAESQVIQKTGQSQNTNSRETESRIFAIVGTKPTGDHGNKSKTLTSGDENQIRNIEDEQQEVSTTIRKNENRKETDEVKKKENELPGKTNQNKSKHNTKVSPTHKNEGNSQPYSSKSNNDQTEKRVPVPRENPEQVVLREKRNPVTSSSLNNRDHASALQHNYPPNANSNNVICQQPQSSNRNNQKRESRYDNVDNEPPTNMDNKGNLQDTPSGTLTESGNNPGRTRGVDEKNDSRKFSESDKNKHSIWCCSCSSQK